MSGQIEEVNERRGGNGMVTTDEGIASGKAAPERMESPLGFFVSVLHLHHLHQRLICYLSDSLRQRAWNVPPLDGTVGHCVCDKATDDLVFVVQPARWEWVYSFRA